MDTAAVKLLTRAARAGLTFTLEGQRVTVACHPDDELVTALRARRDAIAELLAGPCVCGEPPGSTKPTPASPGAGTTPNDEDRSC